MRLLTLISILVGLVFAADECHYTCLTCSGNKYYQCLSCPQNRGSGSGEPVGGMCYCSEESDEDTDGTCLSSKQFNRSSKITIAFFIAMALFASLLTTIISGFRHFFLRTLDDVQQISIIVLINVYLPQQFDIFMGKLYIFNVSYSKHQYLSGAEDEGILLGKYTLLGKTANFLSNQFTWGVVFLCVMAVAVVIKLVRNCLKSKYKQSKRNKKQNKKKEFPNPIQLTLANLNQSQNHSSILGSSFENNPPDNPSLDDPQYHYPNSSQQQNSSQSSDQNTAKLKKWYSFFNKIHNMTWFTVLVFFFNLSLIEININIFTQINHLTFRSGYVTWGTLVSAVFLVGEILVMAMLWIKTQEETKKPEWMRDYAYTAPIYMIRTNYKTVTKYYTFICYLKKILLAICLTSFYSEPITAIFALGIVTTAFIMFSVYCEPYERRYLRIHLYMMETLKIFLYLSLLNFTEKYTNDGRMIYMISVIYWLVTFIFAINFFYILCSLIAQRKRFARSFSQFFYNEVNPHEKLGYYAEGKLHIYERQ